MFAEGKVWSRIFDECEHLFFQLLSTDGTVLPKEIRGHQPWFLHYSNLALEWRMTAAWYHRNVRKKVPFDGSTMLILKLDILETSIRCFLTEYCHTIRLRVILSKPRRFRIDGTSRALSASRQSSTSLRMTRGATCGGATSRRFSRKFWAAYPDGMMWRYE